MSTTSLESEDERRQLKTNQERVKENHIRQKLILGGTSPEPKCNIEKGAIASTARCMLLNYLNLFPMPAKIVEVIDFMFHD